MANTFTAVTPLNIARSSIDAAVLNDGGVFIPGGSNFQGENLADAALYTADDPGRFVADANPAISGGLHSERVDQRAVTLANGQILITGGINGVGSLVSTAELYHPASGHLTLTNGPMTIGRAGHTMTTLKNGMVLIAGGGTNAAELYNPTTGIFSATAVKMTEFRTHHTATLLNDGTVLIAGGFSTETSSVLDKAELYEPTTNSFTPIAAPMRSPRVFHIAAPLPSGGVLLAGGSNLEDSPKGATNSAELYDPIANTFITTANTMSAQRYAPTATTLAAGSVLIADGASSPPTTTTPSADLFNPATGRFSPTSGPPIAVRFFHSAAALPNGTVLIAGGSNGTTAMSNTEIYTPLTQRFTAGPPMVYARAKFTISSLSPGALITGGFGDQNYALPTTELFIP